jgi:hypothetical protein
MLGSERGCLFCHRLPKILLTNKCLQLFTVQATINDHLVCSNSYQKSNMWIEINVPDSLISECANQRACASTGSVIPHHMADELDPQQLNDPPIGPLSFL